MAAAENAISESRGDIPVVFLHLAGLYDERTSVPTFANQIARIYERDFQSHLYSGDTDAEHADGFIERRAVLTVEHGMDDRRCNLWRNGGCPVGCCESLGPRRHRSEEHTSQLQCLKRSSYSAFYLTKKTNIHTT